MSLESCTWPKVGPALSIQMPSGASWQDLTDRTSPPADNREQLCPCGSRMTRKDRPKALGVSGDGLEQRMRSVREPQVFLQASKGRLAQRRNDRKIGIRRFELVPEQYLAR